MNNMIIFGRLTADPESKQIQNSSVVSFTLADNSNGQNAEANFWDCDAFDDTGAKIMNSCKKGHRLLVWGRMKQKKSAPDQQGTTRRFYNLRVAGFQYIEDAPQQQQQPQAAPPQGYQPPAGYQQQGYYQPAPAAAPGYPPAPPAPPQGYAAPPAGYQHPQQPQQQLPFNNSPQQSPGQQRPY